KTLIEQDDLLSYLTVRGEISNLKYHSSGHLYFTLKDEEGELAAVMFRSAAQGLSFTLVNGMKVTAYGRLSVYERSGRYQLYCSAMTEDGIGALRLEYERLYRKLSEEGLFSDERKRPLPRFPNCIGVITSPTGAAIRDIIHVTGRRAPGVKLLIVPSLVQGRDAPAELCRALSYLQAEGSADVIIIGRGGGSMEDLWAFNDEALVRAVAASEIPVISAVGHEIDFTLCDFAADQRAPTPSAAAELAVPDTAELLERLDEAAEKLTALYSCKLSACRVRLVEATARLERMSPVAATRQRRERLERTKERMERSIRLIWERAASRLVRGTDMLNAVNPLAVLKRGYGVMQTDEGSVIASVSDLTEEQTVRFVLADGEARARILSVLPQIKVQEEEG
ncbi:MAG: exodeoxyribonuclease VII large subunit, partial [Clostridia bacterium]|nr:exodeoxyribonuclease VII large subunit [Clostridia bacterium]